MEVLSARQDQARCSALAHAACDNPSMTDLDYGAFDALTFDCYGTLIDWEAGILAALRSVVPGPAGADGADGETLLDEYANAEAALEAGPYRRYREIAGEALATVARAHGAKPAPDDVARLGGSVVDWPAFPDSHEALTRLKTRFRLGVLTNCDDDLFAASNVKLGVDLRLDRDRPAGRLVQAGRTQLRGTGCASRSGRRPAGTDPPRRPEPVPRPCARPAARLPQRLDQPPSRPAGWWCDPAGRCAARRDLPVNGRVRD